MMKKCNEPLNHLKFLSSDSKISNDNIIIKILALRTGDIYIYSCFNEYAHSSR